jgi:hypothetical protein
MSDPVTNAEIEDVLSSIRRLVSTDDREKTHAAETVPSEQDKLVLTPSQRVDEAPYEDGSTVPEETGEGADIAEPVASLSQYAFDPKNESDDAEVAQEETEDVAQAKGDNSDDYVPQECAKTPEFRHQQIDGFEAQEEAVAREISHARDDAHAPEDEPVEASPGHSEAEFPQSEATPPPDLQSRIASVEAALVGRDDEWEPDGEGEGAYAGGTVTALEWEDHRPDDAPEAVDMRSDAADDEGIAPETEALSSEEFTPSSTEQDDHLDAENPEPPAEGEEDWQLQTDVLDEDALRDMVSEIVRQELQGALGERITRNVRKLVRREIHRTLASQEFE